MRETMASDKKIIEEVGESSHDTPQAITITIMDPSALEATDLDSSLVTSVETQDDSHDTSTLLVVPGDGHASISVEHGAKNILQTVTETHMGTHELPVISNISNPEEETREQDSIHVTTKTSEIIDEGEGVDEEDGEEADESVGQHCLICNIDLPSEQSTEPVLVFKTQTTTTQRKMSVFLGALIGQKLTSRKAHSDIMCHRCFGLLDRVDALEVEIRDTKEEIVNKYQETVAVYGGRARRRKPATAKKTDYVFPKVEPEDEDEQVLGLEMDENFEPRVEDLMEEEIDHREDRSTQDEEWEPEFKKPRIKREAVDAESSGPTKRKRGRPRKDAAKPKVEARQRGGKPGEQPAVSTRRVVTVPAAFRKCPHCPTIFMDTAQLSQHLAQLHKDQQQERHCQRCRRRFQTYEDHTACDLCLQTLRQNALPSRAGSEAAVGRSITALIFECSHCHKMFNSRVLAELHCLSTGHNMDQISATKPKGEISEDSATGVVKEEPLETKETAAVPTTSVGGTKTKVGGKMRRGRKHRLIRKNQTGCEACGVECGSVSSLYVHLRANHPAMFPHQCGVCGRRFSLEASAREHERRHAVGELQCPACPLRFSRMSHLHHHAREHHPDFTDFPCQYCGAVTPTVDALHTHIKIHHGDRLGLPAAFACEVCQETFHTGKALACHRTSRHPGTAVCGFCGAQVGSRYLNKHINAVHTKEKTHRCDKCGKDFYSRTSLTGHQKRQHTPRKHLCDLCGKGYVHNVELQRHLKAHRNQRDFKCDFCGRSFLKAVDLTYHRRSHTGERPHQCVLCPESFIRPLGLRKHMLKHTALKKGKRHKYSKRKIEELTSSVMSEEGVESGANESGEGQQGASTDKEGATNLADTDLPPTPDLAQPLQVFPASTLVSSTLPQPQQRLQPELRQLAPSDLQEQQLGVSDLDSSQLEGQLELSQVVEDLSSGELLEMGPGLLLDATDVHGAHEEGVAGTESGDGAGVGEANQATQQPVQVIYVQFVEETADWRSDPPL